MTDGAHALLDALVAWGVEQVFCCPGSTEVPLLDALVDRDDVRFVLTAHESVAMSMADGYARASGRPGVAYLHTNVGLGNAMAHLYAAYTARSPVLVLTGVKPTATLPHRALTTASDIRELARPYCRSDWQALRADALAADVHRALCAATAPPGGPAFLAIPEDVLAAGLTAEQTRPLPVPPRTRSAPDPDDVAAAAAVLGAARRPLVIAGGEVARRGAVDELADLVRLLGAPVVAEPRRDIEATAVRTDDPHYAGPLDPASEVVRTADAILLAGSPTMLESGPGQFPALPPSAALVHLSEDPAELGRRLPVRVALAGDARPALRALQNALKHPAPTPVAPPTDRTNGTFEQCHCSNGPLVREVGGGARTPDRTSGTFEQCGCSKGPFVREGGQPAERSDARAEHLARARAVHLGMRAATEPTPTPLPPTGPAWITPRPTGAASTGPGSTGPGSTRPAPHEPGAGLSVPALAASLAAAWRPGEVLVADAVTATEALLRAVPRTEAGSLFATATGSLGWGMGAALGVALVDPHRPVTCVVRDGVFQFGVPALLTARALDLPVRFVVVNNGVYAAVRMGLRRHGGRAVETGTYPLTSIAGVDTAAVARGYGIPARRVSTAAELDSWWVTAPRDGPSLVDVVVDDGPG